MQKKLIALAVVAAFSAPAFADVTMYGVADAAVVRATGAGQQSDIIAYSGGLAQSRLGAKAVEDLNNGMKAVVVLEYGLDAQTNVGLSGAKARQQMLAVAGDFGTVATGYLQTTGYDFGVKYDPTAGSAVSSLQNVTQGHFVIGSAAIGARAPRALAYISPSFSGVTVAVNYSTSLQPTIPALSATPLGNDLGNLAQNADNKITAYLLSANYDAGALAVGGVYSDVKVAGTEFVKEYALGASYDFTVAKLSGTYQSNTPNGGSSNKAMSVSVVAPVGPGAVALSYAKNTMAAANSSASGTTLAWLQGLSKTTTLYAAYSQVSQGSATNAFSVINGALSNANLSAGGSSTLFAVGLNKKF